MILSIANEKGGVGKTTTALNLSVALAEKGKKACLVSLDTQNNLNDYVGFVPDGKPGIYELINDYVGQLPLRIDESIRFIEAEGIYYIPSSPMLALASAVLGGGNANHELVLYELFRQREFEQFDFVILDCKPSLDLSVMNALAASDGVIIPVQAATMAYDGLKNILQKVNYLNVTSRPDLKVVGILTTMYGRNNMSKAVYDAISHEYQDVLFDNYISDSVDAKYSAAMKKSLLNFRKNCKLADQYRLVTEEVLRRVEA